MPYIRKEKRDLARYVQTTAGELNFALTFTVDRYLQEKGVSYQTLNEVIGVLECTKLELYRRLAAHYEDLKCAENGDVYTVTP